jgi:hypothetical protein
MYQSTGEMFLSYVTARLRNLTSELTGDREACAQSALQHLGVRVERPLSPRVL